MQNGCVRCCTGEYNRTVPFSFSYNKMSYRDKTKLQIIFSSVGFDKEVALWVLRIGVPARVQYSTFAVANICIQTSINQFSHVVVEGNSASNECG